MQETTVQEPKRIKRNESLAEGEARCGACRRVRECKKKIDGCLEDCWDGCLEDCWECALLKVMIGQVKECSFWTDDPHWEKKFKEASRSYFDMRKSARQAD